MKYLKILVIVQKIFKISKKYAIVFENAKIYKNIKVKTLDVRFKRKK